MKIRKVLENPEEFLKYKEKLNYVDRGIGSHDGSPSRFPCLVMSYLKDEKNPSRATWEHLFLYASTVADLEVLYSNMLDENIETITASQESVLMGPKDEKAEWEKFWDQFPDSGEKRESEFMEYNRLYDSTWAISNQEALEKCEAFIKRWPNGSYRSLVEYRMSNIKNHSFQDPGKKEEQKQHQPRKVLYEVKFKGES